MGRGDGVGAAAIAFLGVEAAGALEAVAILGQEWPEAGFYSRSRSLQIFKKAGEDYLMTMAW
jgi:hypothetical protein